MNHDDINELQELERDEAQDERVAKLLVLAAKIAVFGALVGIIALVGT